MKKIFAFALLALFSVSSWATQTYFYKGEGNNSSWAKTAMTVSEDGFYEYYRVTSHCDHQFLIGTASNENAYNYKYVNAGHNNTNVTNIGDWGQNNCYCWHGSEHYILVYYPNTLQNQTDDPIICASTTLPNDEEEEEEDPTPPAPAEKDSIYFVNAYDWTTPKVYLWGGTAGENGWPGDELGSPIGQTNNGHDVYKIVADEGAYTKCIFSDDGKNQTANLDWTSENYFYKKKWYATLPVIQTVKLVPNADWKSADAKFAAWTWGESLDGEWTEFFSGTDTLSAEFNTAADSIDFVRLNKTVDEPKWNTETETNNVWNEVKDTIDYVGLTFTITDWGAGTWEPYIPEVPAKFYVIGDSAFVVDAGLGIGKKWATDAIKSEKDTIVISGLKAGVDYQLKVTVDGTWSTVKGYGDLTKAEIAKGLHDVGGEDHNIGFRLATASDVTVIYTSSLFKLIGDFYVKSVENTTLKFVPSEEWADGNAKFAGWIWGEELEDDQWTEFFTKLDSESDTLKVTIPSTADHIQFVRFSPKAKKPTWDSQDGYTIVWDKMETEIDYSSLVWTIIGWDQGQWTPYDRPCADYGLLINGTYRAGQHNIMVTDWLEYKLLNVELKAGDKLQVRNNCTGDNWVISNFDGASYILTITDNQYVVSEDGTYDFYLKFQQGNDQVFISKAGFFTSSVPSQCEDVMMQAFYNESYQYNDSRYGTDLYGDTKWSSLLPQASEIGYYFDLIWLPPSANGDGMGYHPKKYSNQDSNWGSRTDLVSLINAFHTAGAKVVADIVINHCVGWTSWCDFPEFDFGKFGKFYPDASYICQNDEVNYSDNAGSCKGAARGSYDDGENWDGARDWAHNDVQVQNMFKAYLQWMRDEIGYDGFRYDKGDGFNNWHHDNYNRTAGPYIAFMECYSNTDEIQWRIGKANGNLMGLDFDTKWHVFDKIASFQYVGRGGGLLGRGDTKHAVTFIESHDWFMRGNGCEFGGDGNSMKPELKDRLLQANAFLLAMPGVPCVFYPHWKKYPDEIKAMIEARKWAGVHSESPVSWEEYGNNNDGYQATIEGKYGYLILQLGSKTTHTPWNDNYKLKASGPGYAMWVHRTAAEPQHEYYLVGTKYGWKPTEGVLFNASSEEGEYVLKNMNFEVGDQLKVAEVVNNKVKAWYPANDNYIISNEDAGTKDIYFRPEKPSEWSSNIQFQSPTATFIDNTNDHQEVKVEKFMKDGKMYIRLGDTVYDVLGQTIK